MPYAEEMLTSSQRLHHMAVHRIRKQLPQDAAGVALPRLERAAIFYMLYSRPVSRKRDPATRAPTSRRLADDAAAPPGRRDRSVRLAPRPSQSGGVVPARQAASPAYADDGCPT